MLRRAGIIPGMMYMLVVIVIEMLCSKHKLVRSMPYQFYIIIRWQVVIVLTS
jgi:hypothetical protein